MEHGRIVYDGGTGEFFEDRSLLERNGTDVSEAARNRRFTMIRDITIGQYYSGNSVIHQENGSEDKACDRIPICHIAVSLQGLGS